VVTGLSWQNIPFGIGIDAITGGTASVAVKPFHLATPPGKSSAEHYRFVKHERELGEEIQAAASGKYNVGGVDVSASASYLQNIKFSDLSVTLIAQYEVRHDQYDVAPAYELTDEAKHHLDQPEEFRSRYGDYFLAGGLRASRFIATYVCSSHTAEDMRKFEVAFGGSAPDVFSAQGSASFKRAATDHRISVTADVFMEGYDGTPPGPPWDPETIIKALNWFKEHEVGRHLSALLYHYSMIAPEYPREINIDPSVFVELSQLYRTLWEVRARYHTCADYYRKELQPHYEELDIGIPAAKRQLATDAEKRREYRAKADRFRLTLDNVFARSDFYVKVQQRVRDEPAPRAPVESGSGQVRWVYGYSTYTQSPAVVIQSETLHHAEEYHVGWREHTFQFGPGHGRLIVGWEVISNWDELNGAWSKETDQILLRDYAAVHIKSLYDRGFNWSLKISFVDATLYHFAK
jgi:hypothetical protein